MSTDPPYLFNPDEWILPDRPADGGAWQWVRRPGPTMRARCEEVDKIIRGGKMGHIKATVTSSCARCGKPHTAEVDLDAELGAEDLGDIRQSLRIRGGPEGEATVLCDECDKQLLAVRASAAAIRQKMIAAFWNRDPPDGTI
jgi:hypothetical protein